MKIESLDHVALWVEDRDTLADFLTAHVGMHEIERTDAFTLVDGMLFAGQAEVRFERGGRSQPERPLLNHFGLLVESAGDHIKEAEERGLEIAEVKDAENTVAVFIWGPDRLKLEYVEHKASFSLV